MTNPLGLDERPDLCPGCAQPEYRKKVTWAGRVYEVRTFNTWVATLGEFLCDGCRLAYTNWMERSHTWSEEERNNHAPACVVRIREQRKEHA